MNDVIQIFLLSFFSVIALEYVLNRTLVLSVLEEITEDVWKNFAKFSEFIFMGCIILITAVLIVMVVNIVIPTQTSKKVSHALRSYTVTPSTKEISKVPEEKLEKISPMLNKPKPKLREYRKYYIIFEDSEN